MVKRERPWGEQLIDFGREHGPTIWRGYQYLRDRFNRGTGPWSSIPGGGRSAGGRGASWSAPVSQPTQFSQNPVASMLGLRDQMTSGKRVVAKVGRQRRINPGKQLRQLVDDTKVFKQEFRFKLGSDYGLRNWCQIVCRQRVTPQTMTSTSSATPVGTTLKPTTIHNMFTVPDGTHDYSDALPPVCKGTYVNVMPVEGDTNPTVLPEGNLEGYWEFGETQDNLMFLNLPLTFLEQDMFNMGLGAKRGYSPNMVNNRAHNPIQQPLEQAHSEFGNEGPSLIGPTAQMPEQELEVGNAEYYDRLPDMMQRVLPGNANNVTYSHGSPLEYATASVQGVSDNSGRTRDLAGNLFRYPFMKGWSLGNLDYLPWQDDTSNPLQSYKADAGLIKTNKSLNTIATIKEGNIKLSVNNLGETQCYIYTMVVVNKHVDNQYYSMPESLTTEYLKAAQAFISSGDWSISNNISEPDEAFDTFRNEGDVPTPDMYITHPRIKPFGAIPTRFLERFKEHFAIKFERLTKLGIGQRREIAIELGGLQYSAKQLAMDISFIDQNRTAQPEEPHGTDPVVVPNPNSLVGTEYEAVPSKNGVWTQGYSKLYDMPNCCQQGTVHLLFGLQGVSLPFAPTTEAGGDEVQGIETTEGRWATSALVDVRGKYTEVIKPLTTSKVNPTPIQKVMIALPRNLRPFVTALPRMRTTEHGVMNVARENHALNLEEPGGDTLTYLKTDGYSPAPTQNRVSMLVSNIPTSINLYEYNSTTQAWTLQYNKVGLRQGGSDPGLGYDYCEDKDPSHTSPGPTSPAYCFVLTFKWDGQTYRVMTQEYAATNYAPLFFADGNQNAIVIGESATVTATAGETMPHWNAGNVIPWTNFLAAKGIAPGNYYPGSGNTATWSNKISNLQIKAFYVTT